MILLVKRKFLPNSNRKYQICKNKYILIICFFLLGGLLFRLSPFLFPVSLQDIEKDQFHSIRFYDRHGFLLQELLSADATRSVVVNLEEVSPYFINAIIATEDKNFYDHHGIDYAAILRALYQNIKSGEVVSGGSTITLQLARLVHPKERTIFNKIREAYHAYRLEAGMNKLEILKVYVNRLPMGGNLYGIEGASKAYFGIPARELTLAQATLLAAIPNSPNQLNPYHSLPQIKRRQRIVLERMIRQGMIPPERLEGVLKENIRLKPQTASFLAPHFVFQLVQNLSPEAQTVKTTIDIEQQKLVSEQIQQVLAQLESYHVTNAAAILLDNHSGEVLAYVGSADYFDNENNGQYDGIQALRQPGSALKPFLYLLAMEEGYNPASLISDIPTHYSMPSGIYSPKNYSETFHGPVRLREALANSLNVPAVRTLAKIGTDKFLKRLREYQFDSLDKDAEYYGVGLALGGGEVSLYELTRAYMCLARMGDFLAVREVTEINGAPQPQIRVTKSISQPLFNYLVTDILSDPFARSTEFGFYSVLNLPFPCAAKTGTSFRFCDNWTVGYTQDYTLGVWVGNFDHTSMMKVSGISGAGPIFANIMYSLYQHKSWPEKYDSPEGLVKLMICPLSGRKPSKYCPSRLEEFIPQRDLPEYQTSECTMHLNIGEETKTVVPAEFHPWADQLGIETVNRATGQPAVEIVHPKNKAVYYRLTNLKPEFQSIRFQANCYPDSVTLQWFLNDNFLRNTSGEHEFLWPVIPGNFVLKAVQEADKNICSQVEFVVR
jgi:penicillin-binding protein 1C